MKGIMKKRLRSVWSIVLCLVMVLGTVSPTMVAQAASQAAFTSVGGWSESIYAQISGVSDADVTAVSYSGTMTGSLTGDALKYLVRDYNGGVRIDITGLKAGTYTLSVTTSKGNLTESNITVIPYDRSGYAHYNYTAGVGAYNDDGSLKSNAIVLYVTDENKETVSVTSKDGTTATGIGSILNSAGGKPRVDNKGNVVSTVINDNHDIIRKLAEDGTPLVVRFIGNVTAPYGLTQYDGYDFGGSTGDNGNMARMQSGKDITLEGIGPDAVVDGWGFHFIAQTAYQDFGKSFEVRNITFKNVPEDCIGMEGVQQDSPALLLASVERCWVHNCSFYVPHISNPAESDKSEGDGACDFKRGQYFTNSYCYYEGYHKTNLVGSSNSSLQYNLTYHHNYWKNCESRGPLGRQANMHFYNNLYENQISYAMNTRANAYIFSEYNMFYMAKAPMAVDSGAIKSYNDSFASCINEMQGTIVTDKKTLVSSGNKYENFDTNSELSYIPSGKYELQEDVTEARKVIASKTGVMSENPILPEDVTMNMISVVPSGVTASTITTFPYTESTQKISKTVKAFTVGASFDIEISYSSDAITGTGVLVNQAGKVIQLGSGTVRNLPAGTYVIQPMNFQPGKSGAAGTFKEITINSMTITLNDPTAHYHNYQLVETVAPTCTTPGYNKYACSCGDSYQETLPAAHSWSTQWTIDVEATETTEGSKSHHCTVCGEKKDITVIPVLGSSGGGDEGGGDSGDLSGEYAHNFTASGVTSSFYTIVGKLSTSKGEVSYGGSTLTQCLKMESSTRVTFTAPSAGKLTMVFAEAAPTYKLDDVGATATSNVVVVDIAAGTHVISKKNTANLFFLNYEPDGSTPTPVVKPLTSISLNKSTTSIVEDATETLTVTCNPTDTTDAKTVSWSSSDSTVATVDATGKVTAIKAGTATITATSTVNTSLKATCDVTVTAKQVTPPTPTPPTAEELVRSFVERMYTVVLGRDAEVDGLNFWTNALITGSYQGQAVTGSVVAKQFIEGAEFVAKNLSDEDFMTIMYKAIMDRDADETGMQTWLEVLGNGVSRTFVLNGFMGSPEFTTICETYGIEKGSIALEESRDKNYQVTCFAQRCYSKVLGRKADVEGLNTWCEAIITKQATPKQVAHGFIFSAEVEAMNLTNEQFTTILYRTLMGREPESNAMITGWADYIAAHGKEEAFNVFADGPEFAAIVAGYGL